MAFGSSPIISTALAYTRAMRPIRFGRRQKGCLAETASERALRNAQLPGQNTVAHMEPRGKSGHRTRRQTLTNEVGKIVRILDDLAEHFPSAQDLGNRRCFHLLATYDTPFGRRRQHAASFAGGQL